MTDQPKVLLDKNGRQLQEGDTLRTRLLGSGEPLEGKVFWENGMWWIDAGRDKWLVGDISYSEIVE